ncbi:zinc finger protein 665-like [Cryptotermes secundus]|uniref:zinc finger protein 665-like n=1 Tax=Cryptotermes secundus TaxID=105785 RepID=UPI000CD7D04D|nr:zinc finger protein 665-like [Cryptotermes secundus]
MTDAPVAARRILILPVNQYAYGHCWKAFALLLLHSVVCPIPFHTSRNSGHFLAKAKHLHCQGILCGNQGDDSYGFAHGIMGNLNVLQPVCGEERQYSCNECGELFSHQIILRAHQRIRSGEKPYCRDGWKKSFKKQSHLKTH